MAALVVILASAPRVDAQSRPAASTAVAGASAPAIVGQGPAWSALKPAQREALKPLEREWAGIDSLRKRKWLEIAERYQRLSPPDQARLQARMAEWSRLTPMERGQTRLNFEEAKQAPAQDRRASWEAYQTLSPGATTRTRRPGRSRRRSVEPAGPDRPEGGARCAA